jgi:hypothetical protein
VAAVNEGKFGYIDKSGKYVIEPAFEQAGSFSEGLAPVSKKNMWGYINASGNVVIPIRYSYADKFSNGAAKVMLNNKWLEIDKEGKEKAVEQ